MHCDLEILESLVINKLKPSFASANPNELIEECESDLKQECKINTDMSVPQLAFMLKVFVETEIIKNKNERELIRHVASQITISSDSLRIKYYKPQESTMEDTKHLLIKMLNYIQKLQSLSGILKVH